MSLQGSVAMVTGGAQGIGAGISGALAADGASVAVCDIDLATATATAEALEREGRRAIAVHADVSSANSVRAAVDKIEATLGPVDILVNNAGIDKIEFFVDSVESTWDRLIAVNLKGNLLCSRAVLDSMIARTTGRMNRNNWRAGQA